MARKRKTPGPATVGGYQGQGDPGGNQPAQAPTGMPYGAHQATIAAQQAMPLPQVTSGPPPGAAAPVPSPAPAGGGGAFAQAMQQAAMMAPPDGGLLAPSTRPSEPVTAGLGVGPGPGPEALGPVAGPPTSPVATMLGRVAESTGDPVLAQIAEQARMLSGRT